jgi:hypothetical protein
MAYILKDLSSKSASNVDQNSFKNSILPPINNRDRADEHDSDLVGMSGAINSKNIDSNDVIELASLGGSESIVLDHLSRSNTDLVQQE